MPPITTHPPTGTPAALPAHPPTPAPLLATPLLKQELVSDLLELTERTSGGLNASGAKREQIAELVDELQAFCPRAPLRNPLLYGDYEVRAGARCLEEGLRAKEGERMRRWPAGRAACTDPPGTPHALQVVYTSRPTAAGGPYRTLPGRTVFPGQRLLQSIVEPNVLVSGGCGVGWRVGAARGGGGGLAI